jgi:hypothetical protein
MSELTASIHQFKLFELRVIVFLLFHIWDLRKPLCEGGGGGGGGVLNRGGGGGGGGAV